MLLEMKKTESHLSNRHVRCQWLSQLQGIFVDFWRCKDQMKRKQVVKSCKIKPLRCAQEHILSHKPPASCLFTPCLCFSKCSGSCHTLTASWMELRSRKQHRPRRCAHSRPTGTCIPVLRLCELILVCKKCTQSARKPSWEGHTEEHLQINVAPSTFYWKFVWQEPTLLTGFV